VAAPGADVSERRIGALKGDLLKRFVAVLACILGVGVGVAAMFFGEADDSPGLVLIGILLIVGTLAFGVSPSLRTRSRAIGFIVAAAAVWLVVVGVAGWIENNS